MKPITIEGKLEENVTFYYFDAENYIPILTESVIPAGPAKGQTSTNKFSEYTEVDGIVLPFSFDSEMGPIKVKEIKINDTIDPKIFENK
jgi:hypothetical protein